jgi:hypothetical protein
MSLLLHDRDRAAGNSTEGDVTMLENQRLGSVQTSGLALEVACDESGFSGRNLVGAGNSQVFAHASTSLATDAAAKLLREVHRAIGAKGGEYKSAELMRPRHRSVLRSLLGPSGPLAEASHVHLIDTRFFVLARIVDVLIGSRPVTGPESPGTDPELRAMALKLYHSGEQAYGRQRWREFLTRGANILRTNNRWLPKNPIELFYTTLEEMVRPPGEGDVAAIIARLSDSRPVAESVRNAHLADRTLSPVMEPLIPAVLRAVELWGGEAASITLVHDEQSALTPARIAEIAALFETRHRGRHLTAVQRVDSRHDARVQIADFLAGVARRLAYAELRGDSDGELMSLLLPLVDRCSTWPESIMANTLGSPDRHPCRS